MRALTVGAGDVVDSPSGYETHAEPPGLPYVWSDSYARNIQLVGEPAPPGRQLWSREALMSVTSLPQVEGTQPVRPATNRH
jgi:hypothetical protein